MASPNRANNNNYLAATSAVSANDVWAAGNTSVSGGYDKTLLEHWDGTSWTIVPTIDPSPYHNDLTGVVAISTNDVWIVGIYTADAAGSTIVGYAQHWNGAGWTGYLLNPTPVSFVFAVAATSSTDVWAVGTYFSAGTFIPMVQRWNGSSWTNVIVQQPNSFDNELFSVSATSPTDVWVVGEVTAGAGLPAQSLAEHFDGTNWSVIGTSNSGSTQDNEILWVNALEGGHAVGIGFGGFLTGLTPRQSQAWDLSAANPPPPPVTNLGGGLGSGDNALIGMDRSGAGLWAVGYSRATPTAPRQTLVIPATWDSTSHVLTWGAVGTSANPGGTNSVFFAVAAVSPYEFWAAGYENAGGLDLTLTESYCANHFTLTAPQQATTGAGFSVTVTVQDGTQSTVTSYSGTVHFTSSDNAATLPTNYMFTGGDAGTHTFTGVVLNTIGHQTITVADLVMPLTTPASQTLVACHGACQAPAGTDGSRSANTGAGGTPASRVGVSQSGSGTSGPRVPRFGPVQQGVDDVATVKSAGSGAPATAASQSAPAAAPTVDMRPVDEPRNNAVNPLSAHLTRALAARSGPRTQEQEPSVWYLLLLITLLAGAMTLNEVRRRRFKERSNVRIWP